jgi:hypothetical protein
MLHKITLLIFTAMKSKDIKVLWSMGRMPVAPLILGWFWMYGVKPVSLLELRLWKMSNHNFYLGLTFTLLGM